MRRKEGKGKGGEGKEEGIEGEEKKRECGRDEQERRGVIAGKKERGGEGRRGEMCVN